MGLLKRITTNSGDKNLNETEMAGSAIVETRKAIQFIGCPRQHQAGTKINLT